MHRHPAARLAWCVFGAGVGISLALYGVGPPHAAFVLASLGPAGLRPQPASLSSRAVI
jgi:hypothetical protein